MSRRPHRPWRSSFVASLVLHGGAALLMVCIPLLARGCTAKKPNPQLMFVEFTVAVPPAAPVPEPPEPEPEPPPPGDDIPEPPKKPDPPKPEPPKPTPPKPPEPPKPKPPTVIKQTNRVTRTTGPAPDPVQKGPRLTDKQIADLIRKGAKIGTVTSIPADASSQALGAYSNHVRDRLYAAWQQPESLKNLPGLIAIVQITIQQNGEVGNGKLLRSSGNATMDDSVLKAVRTVKSMNPLPAGVKGPVDLPVEFELAD